MITLNGGNVVRLALAAITVGPRLRKVSDTQVANLLVMAEATGITTPIHVRKVKSAYELIDGAHRLAAARLLGQTEIAALVVACRQDEAGAMEASNNLGAARMSPLQTAVFAASWKRSYYEMHPDRKTGVFKGNQHTGKVVEAFNALTTSMAQSLGIKERWARQILAAGENLTAVQAAMLEARPTPLAMTELIVLSKISDPDEKHFVIGEMLLDKPPRAAAARRAWSAQSDVAGGEKTPVEQGFKALRQAWARATKADRKKFLGVEGKVIFDLLRELREGTE